MDHSFSTYAKFYEKLTFLISWYAHQECVSGNDAYQEMMYQECVSGNDAYQEMMRIRK